MVQFYHKSQIFFRKVKKIANFFFREFCWTQKPQVPPPENTLNKIKFLPSFKTLNGFESFGKAFKTIFDHYLAVV
jgi:hypothetical protein